MLKKWETTLAVAMVLGLAAGTALAQKLTMGGPVSKPFAESLTLNPKPVPDFAAGDSPLLPAGSTEQLPMPEVMPGTPVEEGPVVSDAEEGPVVFDGEEVVGNGNQQGFFAGAGLHILRPVIGNNVALRTTVIDATGATKADTTTSLSWDFSASPSLWLGYSTPSGLGAALTWFRFDQFSRPRNAVAQPVDPITGAGTMVTSHLGGIIPDPVGDQTNVFNLNTYLILDIWDLDVIQKFSLGQWGGTVGGGVRYLHLNQRFFGSVNQTGLAPGAITAGFDSTGNSFSGLGPAILVNLQRPIGVYNLSFYGHTRAGLLFGSQHLGDFSAEATNPGGGATTTVTITPTIFRGDQTVLFGEIELGIQWAGAFGRFYPLARFGFEGREYLNTGTYQSVNGNVGLFGLVFSAGVNY